MFSVGPAKTVDSHLAFFLVTADLGGAWAVLGSSAAAKAELLKLLLVLCLIALAGENAAG
jgi:hypothetical protein